MARSARRQAGATLAEAGVGDQLGELDPGVDLFGGRVVRQFGGELAHPAGDADAGRAGVRSASWPMVNRSASVLMPRLCTFQPLEAQLV